MQPSGGGKTSTLPCTLGAGSVYSLLVLDDKGGGLKPELHVDAGRQGTVPLGGVATGDGGSQPARRCPWRCCSRHRGGADRRLVVAIRRRPQPRDRDSAAVAGPSRSGRVDGPEPAVPPPRRGPGRPDRRVDRARPGPVPGAIDPSCGTPRPTCRRSRRRVAKPPSAVDRRPAVAAPADRCRAWQQAAVGRPMASRTSEPAVPNPACAADAPPATDRAVVRSPRPCSRLRRRHRLPDLSEPRVTDDLGRLGRWTVPSAARGAQARPSDGSGRRHRTRSVRGRSRPARPADPAEGHGHRPGHRRWRPCSSARTASCIPPQDYDQAGWYADGTAPGDIGPAVIAGHVDSSAARRSSTGCASSPPATGSRWSAAARPSGSR